MSENTLKFGDIVVNKKEFHSPKRPIILNLVETYKIVISDKIKHNEQVLIYFIRHLDNNMIRTLCIVLCQINGYIKLS